VLKIPSQAPGRLPAYVQFNNNDLDRVNLYKQAPYLNVQHGHALELIRLRAHAWTQYIPTHLHFSARQARNEYHYTASSKAYLETKPIYFYHVPGNREPPRRDPPPDHPKKSAEQ
jgi:hypothetical protein